MQMPQRPMVRKANYTVSHITSVNCLNLTSAFSPCTLSISSRWSHSAPTHPHNISSIFLQRIALSLPLRGHPSSCYSVLLESSGRERACWGGLVGCGCNVQGENPWGNKMNSLHKYKIVQPDRLMELVFVNTKQLCPCQPSCNHFLLKLKTVVVKLLSEYTHTPN